MIRSSIQWDPYRRVNGNGYAQLQLTVLSVHRNDVLQVGAEASLRAGSPHPFFFSKDFKRKTSQAGMSAPRALLTVRQATTGSPSIETTRSWLSRRGSQVGLARSLIEHPVNW